MRLSVILDSYQRRSTGDNALKEISKNLELLLVTISFDGSNRFGQNISCFQHWRYWFSMWTTYVELNQSLRCHSKCFGPIDYCTVEPYNSKNVKTKNWTVTRYRHKDSWQQHQQACPLRCLLRCKLSDVWSSVFDMGTTLRFFQNCIKRWDRDQHRRSMVKESWAH